MVNLQGWCLCGNQEEPFFTGSRSAGTTSEMGGATGGRSLTQQAAGWLN